MSPKEKSRTIAAISRGANAVAVPVWKGPRTALRTAYFAGLVDGEGWVAVATNSGRKDRKKNVPTITVNMTHKETVLALAAYFGGCVHHIAPRMERRKPQWKWTVRWNDARRAAAAMLPYAITKRDALQQIVDLPIQLTGPERRFDVATVGKIRRSYAGSYSKLGKRFGICTMTAWKICNRKMYADVA